MKILRNRGTIVKLLCIGILVAGVVGYWCCERATVSYAESKNGEWSVCLIKTYDSGWWEGFLFYNGEEDILKDVFVSVVSDGEIVYEHEKFGSTGSEQPSFKQKLILMKSYKQCDCLMLSYSEEKPKKVEVAISQTQDSGEQKTTLILQ